MWSHPEADSLARERPFVRMVVRDDHINGLCHRLGNGERKSQSGERTREEGRVRQETVWARQPRSVGGEERVRRKAQVC